MNNNKRNEEMDIKKIRWNLTSNLGTWNRLLVYWFLCVCVPSHINKMFTARGYSCRQPCYYVIHKVGDTQQMSPEGHVGMHVAQGSYWMIDDLFKFCKVVFRRSVLGPETMLICTGVCTYFLWMGSGEGLQSQVMSH